VVAFPFLSPPTLSIPPRLVVFVRSTVARGPAPWTPAEEHSPSDSLFFTDKKSRLNSVEYVMSQPLIPIRKLKLHIDDVRETR
jgi:hypothetical protein